ncbi:MAG: DUF2227 family putative metal-binding protein [Anaerolineae bacterium]
MPSQQVHDASCLVVAGLLAVGGLVRGRESLYMAAGAALGTLVHPDWDYAEIRGVVADLGPFKYLVKPYGLAIPHRSILSHGPIIGTVGRLAYIFIPLWLLTQICKAKGYCPTNWISTLVAAEFFWWVVLGLMIVDTLHAVMDAVTTGFKRFFHQLFRGV